MNSETLLVTIGIMIGVVITFGAMFTQLPRDEVKNAMLLCQSQVPENVTCRITAIPYEATVRLGQ